MSARSAGSSRGTKPTEAEVVLWLKRGLIAEGLAGRAVREVVVDADQSYLRAPFRRQLEPTGTIWIGNWRPDLVCVVEGNGAERLAGFEVKGTSDHLKGLAQANQYREGVHEAYLCIPATVARAPDWIRRSAVEQGVGLLRASASALLLDVEPAPPRPDPRMAQITRRYLLGEAGSRAFGLNKPLHYAAALIAFAFTDDPVRALREEWGLEAVQLAVKGAETLGLLSGDTVTARGKAFADTLRFMGFTLQGCRWLTATRLVRDAPNLAAVLRSMLLQHPAVDLIVQVLVRNRGCGLTLEDLATQAMKMDEGLARAVFGSSPENGEPWQIRPTTRFQLKAALYDVGIIDSRLAKGASGPQRPGGYDPKADVWQLGIVCQAPARL